MRRMTERIDRFGRVHRYHLGVILLRNATRPCVDPKIGFGPMRFGMSPAQVRDLLPEEQTYEECLGGNLNDSLLYRGLIIGFDACDANGLLAESRFCELRLNRRPEVFI